MAFPDMTYLATNTTEYSDVQETRLMLSYTRSDFFTYEFDPSVPVGTQSGLVLLNYLQTTSAFSADGDDSKPNITQIGDVDSNQPPTYKQPSICVARKLIVDGPGQFHIVYSFECGSGKTVWEELGNVNAELSSYDKDGTLINVNYAAPTFGTFPGALNLAGITGLPGGVNLQIPHVPKLPRYISAKLLRRTRILTLAVPNLSAAIDTNNHQLIAVNGIASRTDFMNYYQGHVNSDQWLEFLPRQVMCSRVLYTTQNNYTVTEVCEFLVRDRTWDEIAVYYSQSGIYLPGTSNIPPVYGVNGNLDLTPNGFVGSKAGMKDPATGLWPQPVANAQNFGGAIRGPISGINGWVRAKMIPEVDFSFDFDYTKDNL